jgi:hypothetical protein
VIIPLPVTNPLDMPPDLIPLTPGVRVRILSDPHQGKVGGVEKVLPDAVNYPSGILARSVRIKLEREGSVVVPIANVEVLE